MRAQGSCTPLHRPAQPDPALFLLARTRIFACAAGPFHGGASTRGARPVLRFPSPTFCTPACACLRVWCVCLCVWHFLPLLTSNGGPGLACFLSCMRAVQNTPCGPGSGQRTAAAAAVLATWLAFVNGRGTWLAAAKGWWWGAERTHCISSGAHCANTRCAVLRAEARIYPSLRGHKVIRYLFKGLQATPGRKWLIRSNGVNLRPPSCPSRWHLAPNRVGFCLFPVVVPGSSEGQHT